MARIKATQDRNRLQILAYLPPVNIVALEYAECSEFVQSSGGGFVDAERETRECTESVPFGGFGRRPAVLGRTVQWGEP